MWGPAARTRASTSAAPSSKARTTPSTSGSRTRGRIYETYPCSSPVFRRPADRPGGCARLRPAVGGQRGAVLRVDGRLLHVGPGVTPPSATAPPECGQSERNYPHLVAAALNLSLTDISCGGAKTENFTVAQFPPNQPAQFSALTPTTEVITTSMGGNDDNLFAHARPGLHGNRLRQAEQRGAVQGEVRSVRQRSLRNGQSSAGTGARGNARTVAAGEGVRRRLPGNHADARLLPDAHCHGPQAIWPGSTARYRHAAMPRSRPTRSLTGTSS